MRSAEEFLAYAIKIEEEATLRFGQLADAMLAGGNTEAAAFFRKLSGYSRQHLREAHARSGFREIPVMAPHEYRWPDLESPETAAIWAADPLIARREALMVALESEKRGLAFYKKICDETDDPEIRVLAAAFVAEEAEHVAWIEKWIERDRSDPQRQSADRRAAPGP